MPMVIYSLIFMESHYHNPIYHFFDYCTYRYIMIHPIWASKMNGSMHFTMVSIWGYLTLIETKFLHITTSENYTYSHISYDWVTT